MEDHKPTDDKHHAEHQEDKHFPDAPYVGQSCKQDQSKCVAGTTAANANPSTKHSTWTKPVILQLIFDFVLMVSTTTYAVFAIKQWRAMTDQVKQMQAGGKQTDTMLGLIQQQLGQMKEQNTLIRQQAVGTVSPILRLGDPPGAGDIQFDVNTGILYFEIFNKGHSIAPRVTLSATVRFLKIGSGIEISNSSVPITQTWTNFAPSEKPEEGSYQIFSNPSSIRSLLAETKAVAELKGNLSYENGFGETKPVPFCRFIFGRFNQPGEPTAVTYSCDNGMTLTKGVENFRSTCQQQHWDCARSY
jgi:hypothetical protein